MNVLYAIGRSFLALGRTLMSNPLARAFILGQARHVVTLGGAYLLTNGFLASGGDEEKFIGAAMVLLSLVCEGFDTKQVNDKIVAAINLPKNSPPDKIAALKNGTLFQ